jgi:hypothetical protein
MTITQRIERVTLLTELRKEFEEVREIIELAKDDEYKAGALKALTNIFSIIDEKKRITNQDGDPSINPEVTPNQDGFIITVDDGFCAWQYELKPDSDDYSINDIISPWFKTFNSPVDHGKCIR